MEGIVYSTAALKETLLKKKVTQKSLASSLKINEKQFSKRMQNKMEFSISELTKIARILGVSFILQ